LIYITTTLVRITQRNITVSNESFDQRILSTIVLSFDDTSKHRTTSINSTDVSIVTSNVGIRATGGRNTRIVGAGIKIVAEIRDIGRETSHTRNRITLIVSASVIVSAIFVGPSAISGVEIASIDGTFVTIVTILRSSNALTSRRETFVIEAVHRCTGNIEGRSTTIAIDSGRIASNVWNTTISGTRVVIVAITIGILATSTG